MVNPDIDSQQNQNEKMQKEIMEEHFENIAADKSLERLNDKILASEYSQEQLDQMGRVRDLTIAAYQQVYKGYYEERIKPVNLDNIEKYEINSMSEFLELFDKNKRNIHGIIYKFTLKDNTLTKRIGKTIDFTKRTGGYLSKSRNYARDSNKLNNFHRALQDALQLLKQENKDAPIKVLQEKVFDYFKVEVYFTENAIDYNGFEVLLTLYENRKENIEMHDLNIQGKLNPIVGDLFDYAGYLSELGIKDLFLILEECFESGMTQEQALEHFKEKTESDFDSRDELKTFNEKSKKIFSEQYNLAMKSYILKKITEMNSKNRLMTKDDMKLVYLIKQFGFLAHSDQKEVIFTTRDKKNNPILLMYGTETGSGLISSFIVYKDELEILWGLKTPYDFAKFAYNVIKDSQVEYDEKEGYFVYKFEYSNSIDYLGVKLNKNGMILELKPYDFKSSEALFLNTHNLNTEGF